MFSDCRTRSSCPCCGSWPAVTTAGSWSGVGRLQPPDATRRVTDGEDPTVVGQEGDRPCFEEHPQASPHHLFHRNRLPSLRSLPGSVTANRAVQHSAPTSATMWAYGSTIAVVAFARRTLPPILPACSQKHRLVRHRRTSAPRTRGSIEPPRAPPAPPAHPHRRVAPCPGANERQRRSRRCARVRGAAGGECGRGQCAKCGAVASIHFRIFGTYS